MFFIHNIMRIKCYVLFIHIIISRYIYLHFIIYIQNERLILNICENIINYFPGNNGMEFKYPFILY